MHTTTVKSKLAALFFLLPLLTLLAGAEAWAAGFRLIYTNDNLGELDGCG